MLCRCCTQKRSCGLGGQCWYLHQALTPHGVLQLKPTAPWEVSGLYTWCSPTPRAAGERLLGDSQFVEPPHRAVLGGAAARTWRLVGRERAPALYKQVFEWVRVGGAG